MNSANMRTSLLTPTNLEKAIRNEITEGRKVSYAYLVTLHGFRRDDVDTVVARLLQNGTVSETVTLDGMRAFMCKEASL